MAVKAVAFLGCSGTGKTTLIEKVLPELASRGYRVGAIKNDAHRFDIDHPGKDSHRFTAAGAETMLIVSAEKLALVKKHPSSPPVEELLNTYFPDLDIVLVEGFSRSGLPKIEIRRKEKDAPFLCKGESHDLALIAVASDHTLRLDVPLLNLNDPKAIADFIESNVLGTG
ncbi:molybdopterin-guanine dinucleotide biosynthesis protein B [Candidatus Deferrimicrobium sp.]|uniref:molybdopterin-guanine dinucleotide biosynthesis protein B n=1 Tax=Candidatus Deferrimicrobium sp. TaxID=3060586 RepID=UPI00271B2EDF|nr:molybdopterin-guanine dinucleotide biosynthesis protein B [Candidatus Deferrimicrobium sp.]MDO8739448.1 molybdopterin-guanine dinucleotide biosynthesis protein B [Candidatus Deferrimicrobium sp.]